MQLLFNSNKVCIFFVSFQGEIYSGAVFMQQLLGLNLYLCVVTILAVVAIYTVIGMYYRNRSHRSCTTLNRCKLFCVCKFKLCFKKPLETFNNQTSLVHKRTISLDMPDIKQMQNEMKIKTTTTTNK